MERHELQEFHRYFAWRRRLTVRTKEQQHSKNLSPCGRLGQFTITSLGNLRKVLQNKGFLFISIMRIRPWLDVHSTPQGQYTMFLEQAPSCQTLSPF